MNATEPQDALRRLRPLLEPLVDRFELDDPARGLLGIVTVTGGVFTHPLTRQPIRALKLYGAGPDRVKIAEPAFLRSLPRIPVIGLTHPSQLCALVAKTLSGFLGSLGAIRDRLSAMGISMTLEYDVLRLLGRVELHGRRIKLVAWRPEELVVTTLGDRELCGSVPRGRRTLRLENQPTADLDRLSGLVAALGRPPGQEPADPPLSAIPETSGVFELTETVLDEETTTEMEAMPATPAPPPAQAQKPQDKPLGAIGLRRLLDRLGFDAEITACGNRLRLMVPLKVVQGKYTFYLEQRAPTRFVGVLHSPTGTRYPVEFDLKEILDIKEVFDRVVMGKNGS